MVIESATAQTWFGDMKHFTAFHWHGETFSLPIGAEHLLKSQYCENQAWSMGKHLALQTHIEMTTDMVEKCCEEGKDELSDNNDNVAVQQANTM